MRFRLIILLSLCATQLLQAQSDSLSAYSLDDVIVNDKKQPIVEFSTFGSTYWNLETMKNMPLKDPVRNMQLLPGIQTNSENMGGTFVQGCDNSHNNTTINGVPIYYPMHLLGFYSTFNALHFKNIAFSKSSKLTSGNRLGADINLETPDTLHQNFGADIDLGMLATQASMRIPFTKKLGATISGRYSNVNLLYDNLINSDRNFTLKYRFYDININLHYQPTDKDIIWFDLYNGNDYTNFKSQNFLIHSDLQWGNQSASLRWKRNNGARIMNNMLYYTSYHNNTHMKQTDSQAFLPSHIHTTGVRSEQLVMTDMLFISYGAELLQHFVATQSPEITGAYSIPYTPQKIQSGTEGSLFAQSEYMLGNGTELIAGLKASAFYNERFYFGIDPRMSIRVQPVSNTTMQLTVGTYTQYLHQFGFSSNGMPSEFWCASDSRIPAQHSIKASLGIERNFTDNKYSISTEFYISKLKNQIEYKGNAIGLITDKYNLYDNLIIGNGLNYGVDVMLQKNSGKLTGWISYSWAQAPRKFNDAGVIKSYPAIHNRVHDLNTVANWAISEKWNLCATWIFATGSPYTEIKYAYIMGENGILAYDEHNSSRFPNINRLDLALRYHLPGRNKISQSITLSAYNATWSKNPVSYNYNNIKGNIIYKRPVYIFSTIVPSVSYYLHF